jgi:hypothetical protein
MGSGIVAVSKRVAGPLGGALLGMILVLGLSACGSSIQSSPDGSLQAPDKISFQQIAVGGEDIREFTLRNESGGGGGAIVIENLQIRQGTDDEVDEFAPADPDAFPSQDETVEIAPGEEVSWDVAYRPENAIHDNGAITFDVQNDPTTSDEVVVPLETREMLPRLAFEPSQTVNFSTDAGEVNRKFIKVTNTGWAPLNVEQIGVNGSEKFTVSFAKPGEYTCEASQVNPFPKVSREIDGEQEMVRKRLKNVEVFTPSNQDEMWPLEGLKERFAPKECFVLIATFEPTDDNAETATIRVDSNAEPARQTVELAGNSNSPCLEISARDVVDFGVSSVDGTTRQTVRIRNCRKRADPLKVSGLKVVNKNGVFDLEPNSSPPALTDGDPSTEVTLTGDQQASVTLTASPPDKGTYGSSSCPSGSGSAALVVNSNDPTTPTKRVCLRVTGDDNACPTAVAKAKINGGGGSLRNELTPAPLETVQFDGTQSTDNDGSIQRYEWTILERPEGSTGRMVPNPSSPKPEMFLDIAGNYRIELKVYDNEGVVSCGGQSIVKINAIPEEAIHVQLVWDTPADPDQTDDSGADLDLHFLNPKPRGTDGNWKWNTAPYDIYYDNQNEDWGAEGDTSDNPSLDIDDTDGAGPENINLNNPPNTGANPYKVGVYYFDTHGFEESYATVRIYIQGSLKKTYKNKYMADTLTFWHVADIGWPSKTIYDRDDIYPQGFP